MASLSSGETVNQSLGMEDEGLFSLKELEGKGAS